MSESIDAIESNGPVTKDKIEKILEGMTDKFNKNNGEVSGYVEEETLGNSKMMVLQPVSCEIRKDENVLGSSPQRSSDSSSGGDSPKKDVQRIVLTFRTVDEKTDHGNKTKISSCPENLGIVPVELNDCDEYEGVSVKVEGIGDEEEDPLELNDAVTYANILSPISIDEAVDIEQEKLFPDLGLKRSSRQASKDGSSVLENAIARKEKFNHTQGDESLSTTRVTRKKVINYKPPGRPRKYVLDSMGGILENKNASSPIQNGSVVNGKRATFSPVEKLPKLIPISTSPIKKKEMIDEILTNDEEPFLRPNIFSNKVRPKNSNTARKIGKPNGQSPSESFLMESLNSGDIATEDLAPPSKRPRRNLAPSPNLAEGNAAKPESAAVLNNAKNSGKTKEAGMQCLCEVNTQLFISINSTEAPLLCTAIDSVEDRSVRCKNELDGDDVAMRRPSSLVSYIVLCKVHKEHLDEHRCCPFCGLFCAQGKFLICSNGHQYHRRCAANVSKSLACPHCSINNYFEIVTSLVGNKQSAKIVYDKQLAKQRPVARMSMPGPPLPKVKPGQLVMHLPGPLIDESLVAKIPKPTPLEKTERFTTLSLLAAVKNNDTQRLVNVLAAGYNANHTFKEQPCRTSLHVAAEKGYLACIHILIQAGAQIDVMDKNLQTPLMLAASMGHVDAVKYLIRVGADPSLKGEDGMTSLHVASKSGQLEVCRLLLSQARRPKLLLDNADDGGWTALTWACEFGHIDIVQFLLKNQSDPFIRDSEQNIALHWSCFSGSYGITELLLNEGSDINVVNVHGDTPLHIAARQDKIDVTNLILARGARVDAVNSVGETPVDCCESEGPTKNAINVAIRVNQKNGNLNERTAKILSNDISLGREMNPIQCVNVVDDEELPTDYVYVSENIYTSVIHVDRRITIMGHCNCTDKCQTKSCGCGNASEGRQYNDEDKLLEDFNYKDPPAIFECNMLCKCNVLTCKNRVIQSGMTERFQLFRTKKKGWGVRTLKKIEKGTYVCEYTGEILLDKEAEKRPDDSYLFDMDLGLVTKTNETYCIDARRYGNIARFINHSCAPNLTPVKYFIKHQDLRFPQIAFFANRDIEADEELHFDYGEKFWIVKGKSFTCTCGAVGCKYSSETIQQTLTNYRAAQRAEEILNQKGFKAGM